MFVCQTATGVCRVGKSTLAWQTEEIWQMSRAGRAVTFGFIDVRHEQNQRVETTTLQNAQTTRFSTAPGEVLQIVRGKTRSAFATPPIGHASLASDTSGTIGFCDFCGVTGSTSVPHRQTRIGMMLVDGKVRRPGQPDSPPASGSTRIRLIHPVSPETRNNPPWENLQGEVP